MWLMRHSQSTRPRLVAKHVFCCVCRRNKGEFIMRNGWPVWCVAIVFGSILASARPAAAGDWPRFRGPNGSGVSADEASPPVEWSETKNLKWKVRLPGPGLSSPIVVGDRVFVTCWSGYAADPEHMGIQLDLKRHLVCLDRQTGQTIWDRTVEAVLPEEPYRGMFAENGYATHTPASDGENVYVFFGKTGVLAFDMQGNRLWQKSVGTDDDRRSWGTAASPILYKGLVIVPATIESHALVALDKKTGEVVWRKEADGFGATWGTPILAETSQGTSEIVYSVPGELWAFDPETGKLNWYCESTRSDGVRSSAVAGKGIVYVIEGQGGGSVAVRTGGQKDVSRTHVAWSERTRGGVGTPVLVDGRLYSISGGIVTCINAETGRQVYQARLSRSGSRAGRDSDDEGRGRSFGGGFGGGPGGQDYSSPVAAGGKLYYTTRAGETHVIRLGDKFEQLAVNRFADDSGDYSATPAITNGELFIRSRLHLYCVAAAQKQ
jgi:outer membrane protein assembly factor BamB